MLITDRDALVCDLAETYGILDMEALPLDKLAVLSFGLRDNSRIKMAMSGMEVSMDRLLLAGCFDMLSWLKWSKTRAAHDGGEPPKSMFRLFCGEVDSSGIVGFASADDFAAARDRILKEAQNGN